MAVTVYRSTDGSAPVLSGTVGTLTALLDACLVNGYGAKSAAGWTKPYTATNAAVFRQGGTGVKMYFQVDDNAPNGTSLARQARVWGFEGMSAYGVSDSAYGPAYGSFPSYTGSEYTIFRKSSSADSTARPWIIVADPKTVHIFIKNNESVSTVWYQYSFGDFYSYITGDQFKCYVLGGGGDATFVPYSVNTAGYGFGNYQATYNLGGWIPRPYVGNYSSKRIGIIHPYQVSAATPFGNSGSNFSADTTYLSNPNADGNVYISKMRIIEDLALGYSSGGNTLRGHQRGMWYWSGHDTYTDDGDTFSGKTATTLDGRTFLLILKYNGGSGGQYHTAVETSSTWDEST